MRVLALIPARGGSKRLPGKNIRPLHGKPLIVWTIEAAQGVDSICSILVSTDDARIAKAAVQAGAMAPWLRPADLATDSASSVDVAIHALDWYEREYGEVDGLLLLQPTSPFRTRQNILDSISIFGERECRQAVIAVSPVETHPEWCFRIEDGVLRPYLGQRSIPARSQDLPPAFQVNGSIYLVNPSRLRKELAMFTDDAVPLVIESTREAIDIDTETDWKIAESCQFEKHR